MSIKLSNQQWGIMALAAITVLIHIVLGVLNVPDTLGILFLLNGVGYLALVAGLYFLPQLAEQRSLIRWVLIAYTAVTIILYFVFNLPNSLSPLGLFNKLVEVALIILLWMDR